jgi:serine/threonine-protein kinase
MTSERYQRVKEVFLAICDVPADKQDEAAVQLCGGDTELLKEVNSLLASHRASYTTDSPNVLSRDRAGGGQQTQSDVVGQIGAFSGSADRKAGSAIAVRKGAAASLINQTHGDSANFSHKGRFNPGDVLADRYRIVSLLGIGGMGEVYRADDLTLDQPVALKFLPPSLGSKPQWMERFHNEVRMSRQVTHPNVCRVFDIGQVDGEQFISMEFVDGEDLSALLRRIGRLPRDKAVQITRQICAGLAAAHDRGVLHRDLKPANIMLDGRGQVRITDFGISAPLEGRQDSAAGTPAYMAPEQFSRGEASVRSDLYSLGLVMYEIFTGRQAFSAHSILEYAKLHKSSTPTNPSAVIDDMDPLVERVILRCLEKDPTKRPASALTVSAALPGGDPLAAALAAGETPSPEMVAAAGDDAGMGVMRAGVLLGITLIGLLTAVLLSGRAAVLPRMSDSISPPAVLVDRAREILTTCGYNKVGKQFSEARGFSLDDQYVNWVHDSDYTSQRWEKLQFARPGPFFFWYRESPEPMVSKDEFGQVTYEEPSRSVPKMRSVEVDVIGRLKRLEVLPDTHGLHPATTQPAAVAWDPLFNLAGIVKDRLAPATATPPMFADARYAWEGHYRENPDEHVRVEAASFEGRPVFFRIVENWQAAAEAMGIESNPGMPFGRNVVLQALLIIITVVSGTILAWRNAHAGRGDWKGAQRVSGLLLLLGLLIFLFFANHIGDLSLELNLFFRVLGHILVPAGIVWMFYLALEPYVRKIWPETVISWSRLLSGKVLDPLVASHVLTGLAVAAVAAVLAELTNIIPMHLGRAAAVPNMTILIRFLAKDNPSAVALYTLLLALYMGLLNLLLLVMFRLLVRMRWLAAVLFIVVAALNSLQWYNESWIQWFQAALVSGLLLLLLVQYGLVAATAGLWGINLLRFIPVTSDMTVWYASQTRYAVGLIAVIAVVAATLATGKWRGRAGQARLAAAPARAE